LGEQIITPAKPGWLASGAGIAVVTTVALPLGIGSVTEISGVDNLEGEFAI